jgi:peptide/nickel transport system ATP-binding protein
MTPPVLRVDGYTLDYITPAGPMRALDGVSLEIAAGRTLGLVGESGSGKSSLAWAIMRYLPANARENDGALILQGDNLRTMTHEQVLKTRGRRASMVFQDPSTSLNPAMRLGDQIAEVLIRHRGLSRAEALAEGEAALERTGIGKPADMMRRYPHEASGWCVTRAIPRPRASGGWPSAWSRSCARWVSRRRCGRSRATGSTPSASGAAPGAASPCSSTVISTPTR